MDTETNTRLYDAQHWFVQDIIDGLCWFYDHVYYAAETEDGHGDIFYNSTS